MLLGLYIIYHGSECTKNQSIYDFYPLWIDGGDFSHKDPYDRKDLICLK